MKPEFEYAIPVYHVTNLEEAAAYFVTIGFELEWSWGERARYAGLYYGDTPGMHLMQCENVTHAGAGLYIQIKNVDEIYAACQTAGLLILVPIADQEYKMRDFVLAGPDGIRVTFGQEI